MTRVFGDDAIGVLPVGLAVVALAAALWARTRLSTEDAGRRSMIVWYLAVVVSLVSVAIPLQLENEWITIGWALNGLAILALWVRLDHPGLKYFGLALLGAATVRLVANPWVLEYHVRSGAPVVNWLAYTYLVPAAALVWSHLLLRPREVDRLTPWESRLYPVEKPIWASCCGLAAVGVVFAWINLAIADFFATGSELVLSFERMPARDTTTSVAWALYALVLLAIGVRSQERLAALAQPRHPRAHPRQGLSPRPRRTRGPLPGGLAGGSRAVAHHRLADLPTLCLQDGPGG